MGLYKHKVLWPMAAKFGISNYIDCKMPVKKNADRF